MTCEVCREPAKVRGYCTKHYNQLLHSGDLEVVQEKKLDHAEVCEVDGCRRSYYCRLEVDGTERDLCQTHYRRVRRTGMLDLQPQKRGPDHPSWVADTASYSTAHSRVRRQRGPAKDQACDICGGPANAWAYDYADPDARIAGPGDAEGSPYSLDVNHYLPLCNRCHNRHDLNTRRFAEIGVIVDPDVRKGLTTA